MIPSKPGSIAQALLHSQTPQLIAPSNVTGLDSQGEDEETSVLEDRKHTGLVEKDGQSQDETGLLKKKSLQQISQQGEPNKPILNGPKEGVGIPKESSFCPSEKMHNVNSSVKGNEPLQPEGEEKLQLQMPPNKEVDVSSDPLENGAWDSSNTGKKDGSPAQEKIETTDKHGILDHSAALADGEIETGQQVGDNCPVCLANAAEATFLTSVMGQGEGLVIEIEPVQEQIPSPKTEHVATSRTDGGFTDENLIPPVGSYGDVKLKDTVRSGPRQGQRATSAVPSRAQFVIQNQQAPSTAQNPRRPQSAVDPTRYYVIDHPPRVMAMGQAANMFSHNGGGHFKTDFQHQREEAWRRTTRHGRQRPLTAIVQRSSSQFPIPQQQLPGSQSTKLINPGIKITRTDGWLAGGRDLYWEGIRKRPKSGHTPGWLEGLPDSMKKQRPRSAFVASLHQQPRTRLSQRPQSGSALIVSSCYRRGNRVTSHYGRPGNAGDVRYMLTFSQQHQQQQQQQAELYPKPQLQISLQQKQQQHEDQLLLLNTEIGLEDENPPPLCSPVSDTGRQDWSFPTVEN